MTALCEKLPQIGQEERLQRKCGGMREERQAAGGIADVRNPRETPQRSKNTHTDI